MFVRYTGSTFELGRSKELKFGIDQQRMIPKPRGRITVLVSLL